MVYGVSYFTENICKAVNNQKISFMVTNQTDILNQSKVVDYSIPFFPSGISWFTIIVSLSQMISVVAAVTYYIVISRNTSRNRKAQFFMQIYGSYQRAGFLKQFIDVLNMEWDDFDDYWENYGMVTNSEDAAKIHAIGNYLEGIGVMVKRKFIDIDLVDDLMTGIVKRYWEKMEEVIIQQRVLLNWPEAYEWTEYLYNKIVDKQNNNL